MDRKTARALTDAGYMSTRDYVQQFDTDLADLKSAMCGLVKRKRGKAEEQIHKAIVQHLRARAVPGLLWFHVPNGGKRNHIEAAKFKAMGVRPGVSDIIAIHNGRCFALELKADNGRATEAQMQFISDLESAGGHGCIAEGLDQAINVLETWGLLRRAAA